MAAKKKSADSSDERRRTRRTIVRDSFNLFLVIPDVQGMSRIYLRDISAGGLCFRSELEISLNPKQSFKGRLYLNPGFYLPVEAKVVRNAGGEVAVEFTDDESDTAKAIAKLQAFFDAAESCGVMEE